VLFVFDNVLDKDITSYEYQLYKSNQVTGSFPNYTLIANPTIYLSGESGSNVFSVAVENSTDVTTIRYYGRVRTKDTSNNYSSWSPLALTDQDTPLIGNQYVSSITAAKITAGKIGAHEIILSQAGPQTNIAAPANMAILRSSDYNGSYNSNTSTWINGTSGWIVAGDGHAEFSSASIRGGLKAESVYINADNRWRRNSTDTASVDEFKVGSSSKYLYFDGTNLVFTGNLSAASGTFTGSLSGANITGATGTFTGNLSGSTITGGSIDIGNGTFQVNSSGELTATSGTFGGDLSGAGGTFTGALNAATGTFTGALNGGTISIGSGNSIFKADSNGIYLGNSSFSSAPFKVTPQGILTANNANVSGSITASSGLIGGWIIEANSIRANTIDTFNAMTFTSSGNADGFGEIKRSRSFNWQWRNSCTKYRDKRLEST